MVDAKTFELGDVIAEGAGLARAASSARYHIPSIRVVDVGLSSSVIGVTDGPAASCYQIDPWRQSVASTMLAMVMHRER